MHDFNFRQVADLDQELQEFLVKLTYLRQQLDEHLPYPSKRETEDGTFFAVRG